ncbi:MAG: HzsA-related protein, partial [Planctomycetota bacterium]
VAPYVKPYTPATRDYSAAEAREMLRRDWLHQIDGKVTAKKVLREIGWAKDIAERIQGGGEVDLSKEIKQLNVLAEKASQGVDAELYYAVRAIKRRIMFADPVVDFDSVLVIDIPFPAGSEWPHETRHRLGYMAVPGGRLMTLKGLRPGGHVTKLMPVEPLHGTFWRPDLSYDGKRVVFSFHPANEKNFHLYEINIDGTGLRQITYGIYDDVDPIYLPDGKHIIFASTRGHNYVRCMPPTNSFTITRCGLDGKGMYLISRNNEPDYLPAMLDDGRVIYTRWEYTDKPLWRAQSLWTMNPDGTRAATYWGNQSVWPDLLKDARQIPGSERVMFTGSAHHNWFSGSIGIIDTCRGLNFPGGLTKVTAELEWPESGNGPVDPVESKNYHRSGRYTAYQNPYPLSADVFLVSANRGGKFVLYLMDVEGNRELIYEGVHNIFHAMPIKPRPKPLVVPDKVDWPTMVDRHSPGGGVIYSSNVYHNAPAKLKGKAKFLRILTMDAKTYSYWYKRPYASTGPVVSMVSSEGVKRILGTVPIEKDGSVNFEAPAGKSLYFQLLDERFRALQTMRSISGVMPGETRGCVGCHEMHSTAPVAERFALALQRGPSAITPPPWGDESISYFRFVQPVLDRYCGNCHQGDGKARKKLDLTLRGNGLFKEPYPLLLGRPTWGKPYQPPENPPPGFGIADTILVEAYGQRDPKAYVTPEPMTKLSHKSRLVEIASSGKHNDVKVDEVSRRRLIAWVDAMGPYRGDEEVRAIADPQFQGIDWLSMRPQIKNAPTVCRP